MKLYIKKGETLTPINLVNVLAKAFEQTGLKIQTDSFSDKSDRWLTIVQQNDKVEVSTTIHFDEKGENITGVGVYEADIKRVVDNENERRVI